MILYFMSMISWVFYKVPQVSTFKSDFLVMKKNLWKYNLKWKKIVDLWSWIWKTLRFFEKEFEAKTYWYEVDLANFLISKVLNKIHDSKSKIIFWNFKKADLEEYDFIYVYLLPKIMEKIEDFIFSKSNKWTIIFSNAFKFKNKLPIEIIKDEKWKEEIYVYKV